MKKYAVYFFWGRIMRQLISAFILVGCLTLSNSSFSKTLSSFDQGMKLYKMGKYEVALVYLERAFKENPLNGQLYFYLGNIYNHKKMFNKSIEAYKRGLELTSNNSKKLPYYYNLARSYHSAKQYKEALKIYNKLQKIELYPTIYLYQGMIHFKLRNKVQTIQAWETYLVKAPRNVQYKSIRRAIDRLKDKNYKWPPSEDKRNFKVVYLTSGSGIINEEMLKGSKSNGKQGAQSDNKTSEKGDSKLLDELQKKEKGNNNKGVDESIRDVKVDSDDINVKDQAKKEGQEFDEIEK